ncbi:hypothetical protein VDGL01_11768 [Verticillium dahliae]
MNFEHQFHILLRISCWTSVGASALRLCSLISIYRKGPQPLGPSRTLSMTYHYSFLLIASIHAILFLSIALAFGVVAEVEQRSRPSIAFGSVVLLSMTGQCFWIGGLWYSGQQAFHPLVLSCVLLLCSFVSFLGFLPLGKNQALGNLMLVTGAGLFRFFIVSQWTIFILEARGTEGRPGGNTLRNTPRIFKLTGHLSIQMVSAVAIPLVCALLWVKINTWESNHLFKLSIPSIVSAAYALRDGCTEAWMWINRLTNAVRKWWTQSAAASLDGSELLNRRPVD